ncbi:XdhC family protein [Parageobacillus thermoglucosidasius]|uniref:XdhC family protein n=1 Tax=Parageobacillus thermoglucosidasius TaxID=1426 RepID=UPI000E156E36|nr:XdhC/CoxI family protein [Parageobacillus thermoglucosidasius]MED4904626.1 XdhC family protein [Parageobacillus thermoglucosidasius]MED4915743.1 XdhC family protein [Parageobacillus thermoglucosidasius]MED4944072.1 XdhC family protein [Parageobacillus thermoglucosidasius]MED4983901.1 XdhC family protein [Parageobacillus thermoglucosidasius]RDE28583.1 XdhC/CoxI family protein [Parageobacillus thermoglucosidasius]
MESYHAVLEAIASSHEQGVLATIIHTDGSAYQKEGACMWISESGRTAGLLSGGCLEETIAIQAKDVLQHQQAHMTTFDMRQEDDSSWGQGAGCNGIIQVLLEPVTAEMRADWLAVKACLDRGEHVLLARKLDGETSGRENFFFCSESGRRFGGFCGEMTPKLRSLLDSAPLFQGKNGICIIDGVQFYIQHYWPKPRLVIFGANPDAKPLVSFAKQAGFFIVVTDWRPALCSKEHLPDADEWVVGFPSKTVPQLGLNKRDFVVIMTHHFQRDQEIIALLRDQPLFYLGVLGPKRRTARLLSASEIPSWIHSPVGLAIGARGPEEIAISIIAEMISVLRNGPASKKKTT